MKILRAFFITAIAAIMLVCLSGCSVKVGYSYENGDKYTAGDREIAEQIEVIDVDYMAGDVTLKSSGSGKITVKETTKKDISDELKVHTWVDGKTLHVKYCAASEDIKPDSFNNLDKSLEITVPSDAKLSAVIIDSSAGKVDVDCSADEFDIDISSGDLTLVQHGECNEISIDSSSGSVDASVETAGTVNIDISAGDTKLKAGSIRNLSVDSSSGTCEFSLTSVPEKTEIDTSAGDVTVYLPEDAGLTAEIDISSGEVVSELPASMKDEEYIFGDGKNEMELDVSSGDVTFKALK